MGKFKPGQTGNPNGRPKRPEIEELRQAIKETELKKKKKLMTHFVERAFESDNVLDVLMKKMLPDKIESEFVGNKVIVTFEEKPKENPKA